MPVHLLRFCLTAYAVVVVSCSHDASPSHSAPAGPALAASEGSSLAVALNPEDLVWNDVEGSPKMKIAVLHGNPSIPGPYTIRIKFAKGVTIPPHRHTTDEYGTVISGKIHLGIGERLDRTSTREFRSGALVIVPAGTPHYAWTEQETVMQLHEHGPRQTIFVDSGAITSYR